MRTTKWEYITHISRKPANELLKDKANSFPHQLSGGEQQRVAIARSLVHRPKLLVADEPTGNLDPENDRQVFEHLSTFHQSGGTVIVVTHGSTADGFADRIVELKAPA